MGNVIYIYGRAEFKTWKEVLVNTTRNETQQKQNILKRGGCKSYKKHKVPELSEKRMNQGRKYRCCRKLIKTEMKPVVTDDAYESYFLFRHAEMLGNDRFYTKDKFEVSFNVRHLQKKKF